MSDDFRRRKFPVSLWWINQLPVNFICPGLVKIKRKKLVGGLYTCMSLASYLVGVGLWNEKVWLASPR